MADKHIRATFRAEIKTRLTGIAGTSRTPVDGFKIPVSQNELPGIAVSYGSETIDSLKSGPEEAMLQQRTLPITIAVMSYNPDDLDVMVAQIEARMEVPIAVGVSLRFVSTDNQDPDADAERVFYSSSLNYDLKYTTVAGEPWRLAP